MKLIVAFRNFVNAPNKCTFCPHSAFCVFPTIHAINTTLSVLQRSHVSCAVRTEYLVMRPLEGGGGKILSRPYPGPQHQQVLFLNSRDLCYRSCYNLLFTYIINRQIKEVGTMTGVSSWVRFPLEADMFFSTVTKPALRPTRPSIGSEVVRLWN